MATLRHSETRSRNCGRDKSKGELFLFSARSGLHILIGSKRHWPLQADRICSKIYSSNRNFLPCVRWIPTVKSIDTQIRKQPVWGYMWRQYLTVNFMYHKTPIFVQKKKKKKVETDKVSFHILDNFGPSVETLGRVRLSRPCPLFDSNGKSGKNKSAFFF